MISAYQIRPMLQELLKPLLKVLRKAGVTANGITWSAILLSAGTGAAFWFFPNGHTLWVFSVALLVRMTLNTLDGMMARMHGMKSAGGEVLNELGDVVSDTVMYLPLVKLPGVTSGWVLWFIFLALLNEFIGVLTKAATGVRRYDGPMGKSDRALVLGLTCLLFYFLPAVMVSFDYIFAGLSIFLVVSSTARVRSGLASTSQ